MNNITVQFEQQLEADVGAVDKQSAQDLKNAKRPRMNFYEIGIPRVQVWFQEMEQCKLLLLMKGRLILMVLFRADYANKKIVRASR